MKIVNKQRVYNSLHVYQYARKQDSINWHQFVNFLSVFQTAAKLKVTSSVLFFSRPRSEGWPHHGRTFSIYPCPLSY